jgi:hypothetical protein
MKKYLGVVTGRGDIVTNLFADPKSWAEDYKDRWKLAQTMKMVVRTGTIDRPNEQGENVEIDRDLWNVWFLLTENGATFCLECGRYTTSRC